MSGSPKRKTIGKLITISLNDQYILNGLECGAQDGLFKVGDMILQCPGCNTFYHVDCWVEYEGQCSRKECSKKAVIILTLKDAIRLLGKSLSRLITRILIGVTFGALLGLLFGATGLAVKVLRSWTASGLIVGGIYGVLFLAIISFLEKKLSTWSVITLILSTLVIGDYPKVAVALNVLISFILMIVIVIYFGNIPIVASIRVLYIPLSIVFVFLSMWLSLIISKDGNMITGLFYIGGLGAVLGIAIASDDILS